MRLLNVNSLEFTIFHDDHKPAYVAASHRWLSGNETTFQDVRDRRGVSSKGYQKVEAFAKFIREHLSPIQWLWVDTCCINQDNAAELSEAINLMFEWYQNAELCLAYLVDVDNNTGKGSNSLEKSEWFRRGWTLQELLAPRTVVFVTKAWQVIGYKGDCPSDRWPFIESDLGVRIGRVTGIPERVLRNYQTSSSFSIEEKLRWMDGRATTRPEDMSYALFGILDVTLGANYGEKHHGARRRLIAELERQANGLQKSVDWLSSSGPGTKLVSAPAAPQAVEEDVIARIARMRDLSKALYTASLEGRGKEVQMLLDAGADVNPDNVDFLNPLVAATSSGYERVVQMLLDAGADPNGEASGQSSALALACERGSEKIVQMLVNAGADVKAREGRYGSALQAASASRRRGGEKTVRILLDAGADVNGEASGQSSALALACERGSEKIVQMLLDAGADVNGEASGQSSALALACERGSEKIVQMLLDAGADVNARGGRHGSALQAASASSRGGEKTVRILLDAGADVNVRGGNYGSALSAAVRYKNIAVEQMLRNAGAV